MHMAILKIQNVKLTMSQREEVQPGCPQKTESTAWIYQGRSSHAFQEDTSYLGPFNGHVNGALVMKELEKSVVPMFHRARGRMA